MKVTINGIEYVPKAEVKEPPEGVVGDVVRELVSAIFLYSPNHGRDLWNTLWSVLTRLAPEVAHLAVDDPQAALVTAGGEDDE